MTRKEVIPILGALRQTESEPIGLGGRVKRPIARLPNPEHTAVVVPVPSIVARVHVRSGADVVLRGQIVLDKNPLDVTQATRKGNDLTNVSADLISAPEQVPNGVIADGAIHRYRDAGRAPSVQTDVCRAFCVLGPEDHKSGFVGAIPIGRCPAQYASIVEIPELIAGKQEAVSGITGPGIRIRSKFGDGAPAIIGAAHVPIRDGKVGHIPRYREGARHPIVRAVKFDSGPAVAPAGIVGHRGPEGGGPRSPSRGVVIVSAGIGPGAQGITVRGGGVGNGVCTEPKLQPSIRLRVPHTTRPCRPNGRCVVVPDGVGVARGAAQRGPERRRRRLVPAAVEVDFDRLIHLI